MPICPLLFSGLLIIGITNRIILKRSIKPTPLVRSERNPLLQPLHKIRVTSEEPTIQKRIVASIFQHTPRVTLVPATAGEEGCRAEYFAESAQVYVQQAPALEEGVFFFVAEDLFVALCFD